jgi:hypothetical protein
MWVFERIATLGVPIAGLTLLAAGAADHFGWITIR